MYFHNGHILTFDPSHPEATAMTVESGTIHTVDTTSGGESMDLQRRLILPGFNDAHVHIWKLGQLAAYILDLRGVQSIRAIQDAVQQKARQLPAGTWIVGRGFNERVLNDGRMPNRFDLDEATQQHPVYLIRTCAHIAAVNSLALQICAVDRNVEAPAGGVVGKSEHGEPDGLFYETALGLITRHMPAPTHAEYKDMIRRGADLLVRAGVTSATDPAVHPELLKAYLDLSEEELPLRVNLMPILLPDGGSQPFDIPALVTNDRVRVTTVKFFADGGLSGRTAALSRPYKGTDDKGVLRLTYEPFLELARKAQKSGFRIGTHAIGDEAIGLVLRVYEQLYAEFGGTRNRIEHFGLPEPAHVASMRQHDFVAVPQPIFLHELGENFISALDEEYLQHCYPVRSLREAGIPVAFSTDAPVVREINPWKCVEAAVRRLSHRGKAIALHEAVSVREAISMYTQGSAFAEGTEKMKGMIKAGHMADFIIVNEDPLQVAPDQLGSIRVEEVYIGGKCVFKV
ncbi:MAG: amidohydrolase [Cyclobacteriaceae bacterium]